MGFWDDFRLISTTGKKEAKTEVLKEIQQQRRILKGDKPVRKGKPIYNWFNDGVSCKPKINNLSWIYTTTQGLNIYNNSPQETLDKIEGYVNDGSLDKELQELQQRMDERSEKLRKAREG